VTVPVSSAASASAMDATLADASHGGGGTRSFLSHPAATRHPTAPASSRQPRDPPGGLLLPASAQSARPVGRAPTAVAGARSL